MPSGVYEHKSNQGFQKGHKVNLCKKNVLGKHWKLSEESKIHQGLSKKGIINLGEKSHLWKDGRCKNKDYVSWIRNKRNRVKKRINDNGSFHTFQQWELLKKKYNYTCPCCEKSEPEIKLTEDHIIPLSKGGSDFIGNIQPLCRNCNCKKYDKIVKYV